MQNFIAELKLLILHMHFVAVLCLQVQTDVGCVVLCFVYISHIFPFFYLSCPLFLLFEEIKKILVIFSSVFY